MPADRKSRRNIASPILRRHSVRFFLKVPAAALALFASGQAVAQETPLPIFLKCTFDVNPTNIISAANVHGYTLSREFIVVFFIRNGTNLTLFWNDPNWREPECETRRGGWEGCGYSTTIGPLIIMGMFGDSRTFNPDGNVRSAHFFIDPRTGRFTTSLTDGNYNVVSTVEGGTGVCARTANPEAATRQF